MDSCKSLANVKNVLLVLSGKGGVGKSSVTAQLALCLAERGLKIGVLDIDLTGPSIPLLLGLLEAKVQQGVNGWIPCSTKNGVGNFTSLHIFIEINWIALHIFYSNISSDVIGIPFGRKR